MSASNTDNGFRQILLTGLWRNNPGLVQLLGICPLLAISNSLVNGLGLGLATLFVLSATNTLVSSVRRWIPAPVRLPAFVLIIAAFVTVVELLCKAYFFDLYLALGIFLPLIITNCTILARAEAFASRQPVLASLADGFAHGAGFAILLTVIGGLRELIGRGALFSGAEMLLGRRATGLQVALGSGDSGLKLALIPAGAFFVLALLVALRNLLILRRDAGESTNPASASMSTADHESG